MLADGIGNTLGLHLTGAPGRAAFLLLRRVQINIVQLGMGNLVDQRLYGLQFAFALVQRNALVLQMVIAVCAAFNLLKADGDRRGQFQRPKKIFVLLNAARQPVGGNIRDLLALGLAHIKNGHHLKGRDFDFLLLHNGLAVRAHHRPPGVLVYLFNLFFDGIGCGSKDFNALFSALNMTLKLVPPLAVACHKGSVGLLHHNQQRIIQTVIMELGHRFQIILVAFTLKQVFHALLQMLGDLLDLARCVGGGQLNRSCFKLAHARAPF